MNENNLSHGIEVNILTSNMYLNKALNSLINECLECERITPSEHRNQPFLKVTGNFTITFIDIEYIYTSQNAWNDIHKKIVGADYCIFISLTDVKFDGVPLLLMGGAVNKIKKDLTYIIKNARQEKTPLTTNNLLSSLNLPQKEFLFFFMSGYSMKEISHSLGRNIKTIYHLKTSIMERMKLNNNKKMHIMLVLCRFLEYHSFKENIHALGRDDNVNKIKSLQFL